jgi:hypothetical protein
VVAPNSSGNLKQGHVRKGQRQLGAANTAWEGLLRNDAFAVLARYMRKVPRREGNLVTRSGGLWLCTRDTHAQPGANHDHWRLIVKAGRAPNAPEGRTR